MQITVVRSGSSCPLGEVLEHSEKVGPGGGGVAYIYIYEYGRENVSEKSIVQICTNIFKFQ